VPGSGIAVLVALQFTVVANGMERATEPNAANEPELVALEANPSSISEVLVHSIVPANVPVAGLNPIGTRTPELPCQNLIESPLYDVAVTTEGPQAVLVYPGLL